MPAIPYLPGLPTEDGLFASYMNTLVAEASRRAELCLDGKSIFFLISENPDQTRRDFEPFLGQVFQFGNANPRRLSGYFGTVPYDHQVFLDALASASPLTYPNAGSSSTPGDVAPPGGWPRADEARKWLRINPLASSYWTQIGKTKANNPASYSLLGFSLEAHKLAHIKTNGQPEDFWVWETYSLASDTAGFNATPVRLSRIHAFHQAEIVAENSGPLLEMQSRWNRFNFFRFHNLNAQELNVKFKGTNGSIVHALTVSPWSSMCVRRDSVDGTYTDGYKYFQKFIPGDPRLYQHGAGTGLGANVVANPSGLIPFVNRLLAGAEFLDNSLPRRICAAMAMLDPHVRAPLPSKYSDQYAPALDDSLLGDCLHHKGTIIDRSDEARKRFIFDGYGKLTTHPEMESREVGDDVQVKSPSTGAVHDFISLSTNLFCTSAQGNALVHPVIDGSAWFTLDRHVPPPFVTLALAVTQTQSLVRYYETLPNGGVGAAVDDYVHVRNFAFPFQPPLAKTVRPHKETLADVKKLYAEDFASSENTISATVVHSSGGLTLCVTQTIPLDGRFVSDDDDARALGRLIVSPLHNIILNHFDLNAVDNVSNTYSLDDTGEIPKLIIKRALIFTGYGFPDTDNWFFSGFYTPREVRTYSDCAHGSQPTGAGPHPDFVEGESNIDGRDVSYAGNVGKFIDTEISILSPLNTPSDFQNGTMGILPNNDVLLAAIKNADSSSYWAGNRTRLLQNRVFYSSDEDGTTSANHGSSDAVKWFRFYRMEISALHYNNLAAKVNSIVQYKRLNFQDHGIIQNGNDQTRRYRLWPHPNRSGIFEDIIASPWFTAQNQSYRATYLAMISQFRGMRPRKQYERANQPVPEQYLGATYETIAGYAGIPVRTLNDLPESFATRKSTKALYLDSVGLTFEIALASNNPPVTGNKRDDGFWTRASWAPTITPTIASAVNTPAFLELSSPIRPDLDALTSYKWLHCDDVKAWAEANGYKFAHVDFGVGYELLTEDADEWELNLRGAYFVSNTPLGIGSYSWNNDPSVANFGPYPNPPTVPSSLTVSRQVGAGIPNVADHPARFIEFCAKTGDASPWIAGLSNSVIKQQEIDWADHIPRPIGSLVGFNSPLGVSVIILPRIVRTGDGYNMWYDGALQGVIFGILIRPVLSEKMRRALYTYPSATIRPSRPPNEYTDELLCESATVVKILSTGMEDAVKVIETPAEFLKFEPNFSGDDPVLWLARWNYGTNLLPFTVEDGAKNVKLWADLTGPIT